MSFSANPFLEMLKPFQRTTVDYVFDRFFGIDDPVDRFLVADEVGLGKTMIARGLIAKLIERDLQQTEDRIDVVYICSNQAIAQQNFEKLAIVGNRQKALTDRITTLPLHLRGLSEPVTGLGRGINVIPITPTTSLDLRSSTGRSDERALLWRLLGAPELVGPKAIRSTGLRRVFQPPVTTLGNFDEVCAGIQPRDIDPELWDVFVRGLATRGELLEEVKALADAFRRSEQRLFTDPWRDRRIAVVTELRQLLARQCVHALEPDLVILDEFQRFPRLLEPGNPTGELAHELFGYPGCKTLLLSATPYKMLSRARELDESHHADFVATTRFLLDDDDEAAELESALGRYRTALRAVATDGRDAVALTRDDVRSRLSRVMCRTERLGAAADRNGMLDPNPEHKLAASLSTRDLRAYRELDEIAKTLETRDVVEFWKSAPYPLNLMDDQYELSRRFAARAASSAPLASRYRLPARRVASYQAIDPGNARLRGLVERLVDQGAWKCLWLPPSLSYYGAGKPFSEASLTTKRLLFSRWTVVPKAIAALTSYAIDQTLYAHGQTTIANSADGRKKLGAPLQWREKGALTEVLLVAPGRELGRLTDPLMLARDGEQTREGVLLAAERAVRKALRSLDLPDAGGRPDLSWYVIAMLRLDEQAHPGSVRGWLRTSAFGDYDATWRKHVWRLEKALVSNHGLGAVPEDLAQVLAYCGIAAPGVSAYRALERRFSGQDELSPSALRVANALRLMLNLPESVGIIRGFADSRARIQTSDEQIYWRAALNYCVAGNLQAVLDEYVHVLVDWVGTPEGDSKLGAVTMTAIEAIGVQAASLTARNLASDGRELSDSVAFRTRFALALQQGKGEDQQAVQRVDTVRKAFNSPFWPFVLATTSIGQEGLDFHLYSHAIVHWNLPSNPVDLEQREGRVHRFKNHAVRRNLAADWRAAAFAKAPADPWSSMFAAAPETDGGLRPYWIYPGQAKIERHVPAEPLSVDRARLEQLVRLLGIYRLAFGQPRQDELLAALQALGGIERPQDLVIDLSPPRPRV